MYVCFYLFIYLWTLAWSSAKYRGQRTAYDDRFSSSAHRSCSSSSRASIQPVTLSSPWQWAPLWLSLLLAPNSRFSNAHTSVMQLTAVHKFAVERSTDQLDTCQYWTKRLSRRTQGHTQCTQQQSEVVSFSVIYRQTLHSNPWENYYYHSYFKIINSKT